MKRKELKNYKNSSFKELIKNPLLLAVIGGALTLMTSIITSYMTANANRDAEILRFKNSHKAEALKLQSDILKTYLATKSAQKARENLVFLIESGLIPDHEKRISEYLKNNEKTPLIAEKIAAIEYPNCLAINSNRNREYETASGKIGISIHLGLNTVNPDSYNGWKGNLRSPYFDAHDMSFMAKSIGYTTNVFTDYYARSECIYSALDTLSQTLKPGDTLLLTYSGHGGQIPDKTGAEPDKRQETWVLYDKQIIAQDLYNYFDKFRPGVKFIIIQDCVSPSPFRQLESFPNLEHDIWVINGAKEGHIASEGEFNGYFTSALLKVWNYGKFKGNYNELIEEVKSNLPDQQKPALYYYGPNSNALNLRPFRID